MFNHNVCVSVPMARSNEVINATRFNDKRLNLFSASSGESMIVFNFRCRYRYAKEKARLKDMDRACMCFNEKKKASASASQRKGKVSNDKKKSYN